MCLFLIFFYSLTIFTQTWASDPEYPKLRLVVSPTGQMFGTGPPILVRKVDESLNLTCRLQIQDHETVQNYNISWNWQFGRGNNVNRVIVMSLSRNEANLVFEALKESDSGEYTCKCSELNLSENVRIKVKSYSKKYCSDKMFVCSAGQCIGKHYVCDGRQDCKDGIDEAFINCGSNPCEGKIPCEDGRCIPSGWCCDEIHDPNCTVKNKPKCCQQLLKPFVEDPLYSDQHFSDMGFLQTTIYTVIGCAMAFMFIVTILVIAICRVHIKRTIVSRCPLNHQHLRPGSPLRPTLPLYDIDMFLDRHNDTSTHPGLLVTYNINNGVQFVGRPVDPPPYCEVMDTPPREGPPPPYVSRENISVPTESAQENFGAVSRELSTEESDGDSTRFLSYVPAETEINTSVDISCELESREIEVVNKNEQQTSITDEICSSPSVSGLNTKNSENTPNKKHIFNDFSDSESDSMESDALLSESTDRKDSVSKTDDDSKITRSSSLNANVSTSPPSFLNNITAVSKTLIGSLKRQTDNDRSKLNRQLITQKSFDSSDPCDVKVTTENSNFNKVTHSVGDLSPVNADFERLDFLTLPLRESFIGVRNEEV